MTSPEDAAAAALHRRNLLDVAVAEYARHQPSDAAQFPAVDCSCGSAAAGPAAHLRHRLTAVLDAVAEAAAPPAPPPVLMVTAAPAATSGTTGSSGRTGRSVEVYVAVFAGDEDDAHRDPIGGRVLDFPAALLDRSALILGAPDVSVADLTLRFGWEGWLARVREAIEDICRPCPDCGGSTLCALCVGATATVETRWCGLCGGSGRCRTCSHAEITAPIRHARVQLQLVDEPRPESGPQS
jgi:hypothetical protein